MGSHRPIHPDPKLDAFLGNMVADRGCEVDVLDDYVILYCRCASRHWITILKYPAVHENYAERKIEKINEAFTCS